jgi:enoyl-CoA hydratase/carnithine racemase
MSLVLLEIADGVATITLNNPDERNTMTAPMVAEIVAAMDRIESDPAIGALVVTGTAPAFCAGANLGNLAEADGESLGVIYEGFLRIARSPLPTIAAVNGAAAGLGLVQALMCDMRFAADTAKFTCAFSKRGLIAEYGISWVLPRLVGQANALDLLMSSRVVMAAEAKELGMVNKVVPADQLMDVVMAYAADLAMNVSPSSMSVMKRQVYGDYDKDVSTASLDALKLMGQSFTRPDFKEGVVSYLQKRQAQFPPVDPSA